MSHPSNNISLNVHLAVPQSNLQDGSHTPNTPEILNSIVNMQSGPFADFQPQSTSETYQSNPVESSSTNDSSPSMENLGFVGSQAEMVQQYKSQFIKDSLRLKLAKQIGAAAAKADPRQMGIPDLMALQSPHPEQQHHQQQQPPHPVQLSSPPPPPLLLSPMNVSSPGSSYSLSDVKSEELTEDDILRRMRRRERNKVAATKCRNKKKMKTQILIKESETLVVQNQSYRCEIAKLEIEKKRLMEILSRHQPICSIPAQRKPVHNTNHGFSQINDVPPVSSVALPTADPPSGYQPHTIDQPQQKMEEDTFLDHLPTIKVENLTSPVEEEVNMSLPSYNYFDNMEDTMFLSDQPFQRHYPQFSQPHQVSPPSPASNFLGLRTLGGHTYMELDTRCLAL